MSVADLQNKFDVAVAILERNAKDFLNEGVAIILKQDATIANVKLAVVSVQTSTELLAKLLIIKNGGLKAIMIGTDDEKELQLRKKDFDFVTIGYSQALRFLEKNYLVTKSDRLFLKNVQMLRNSLSHFGIDINVPDVRVAVCWLLVRALALFAAGDDRDRPEFQSHAQFLNEENLLKLINDPSYRSEALDAAADDFDTEHIYKCWDCKNASMAYRTCNSYFCWCCGLTADATAVAYTNCTICGSDDSVYYDRLNPQKNTYFGKCIDCDTHVEFERAGRF